MPTSIASCKPKWPRMGKEDAEAAAGTIEEMGHEVSNANRLEEPLICTDYNFDAGYYL